MERKQSIDPQTAQKLEKSLKLAQGDLDYVRNAYQQATQSAGQLQAKNSTLAAEVKELERKANDNVVKVNQTQDRQEVAELSRLLADQRAVVRDREAELNRLRDDVELPIGPTDVERRPMDTAAVREVFGRLQFRTLLERAEQS